MWTDSKDAEINHNGLDMWQETIVLRMQPISSLSHDAEVNLACLLF